MPNANPTINLALDTINIGKQALVFTNTKRSAEKTAEDISKEIKSGSKELDELSEKILHTLASPTKQCERLAFCIRKGIAYHHAGLVHKQKELIEESFRNGLIKVICCTPTLAYGVDLPAFRAILKDLRRYGHRGMHWIPTLEYLQMCGRAGRPNYDSHGEAIAIAATDAAKREITERYINGESEEVYSKLAVEPVLRTYLLSLISSGFVKSKKEILDFFEKTFWAHQFEDMARLEKIISKMLKLLKEFKFIQGNHKEYKATLIGKRVAQLYIDPLTAHHLISCLENAGSKVKIFSFLQMISHTLEMRPLLRMRTKEYDDIQDFLLKYESYMLEKEPSMYEPEYESYLNSVKTAMFFNDWVDEINESELLEKYNIRPGETRIKLSIGDWLLYASEELARMLKKKDLLRELMKTRIRLKNGVKEELLPLLKLREVGRVRARKLFRNRIKDIGDVKKADIMKLGSIVGKKTAAKIKEQVGQKVSESLNKY